METQTIIETTVSAIAIRASQLNLFTGEPDTGALNESVSDLQGWLFDPDWNLVLPDNVAGREIFMTKVSLSHFFQAIRCSSKNLAQTELLPDNSKSACRFGERV